MDGGGAIRLSSQQVETYRRDGLVIPDYVLPRDLHAQLLEALERLICDNPNTPPEMLVSAHITDGPDLVKGQDAFLEFCHHKPLLDMVEQVLGPDIILWGCHMFCKPPGKGREVPWHQDGRYWPIRPLATCTVWVALDDSTPDNGCMRFIPGSHRRGHTFQHRQDDRPDLALDFVLEDGDVDMATARDVVLPAGRMSLHDIYLVHGSNPNRSAKRRAGLAVRYMPATSLFDRAYGNRTTPQGLTTGFATRPIWLARGQDRAGNQGLMARR
jgi:Phytanoyl-CoA dioxygenase (PhyH)